MLKNAFDKKFVLAFYNSFLKTELNYGKENHVNFQYMQFSKEDVVYINMCSDLFIDSKCALEYGLKDSFVLKNL